MQTKKGGIKVRNLISVMLVFSLLASVPAAHASRADAIAIGRNVIATVQSQTAYCARETFTTDFIGLGQIKYYSTFLYAGNRYIIAVGGDGNARDLDIGLVDGRGNALIDQSNLESGLLKFDVATSGEFILAVKLASGARNGAWIYIIHFYVC
jgi:hypothetical protein